MLFTALIVSLGFLWFHLHVPRSLYQSQVHGKKICHGQLTNQNGFPRCINALFVFFASLQWRHLVPRLPYTLPLICMSLNKNSIYCVMLRSSKNADQRKQWWYRVAGYSAVAPPLLIPPKFPGLFPKWKAPYAFRAQIHYVSFTPSRQACLVVKF